MAGKTLHTEIRNLLQRFLPVLFPLLRWAYRSLGMAPAALLRPLPDFPGFQTPPSGFYSGVGLLRQGGARGGVIFDSQQCPLFPEQSLVVRSGLGQDRYQPWPLFWLQIDNALLVGRSLVPKSRDGHLLAEATFSQSGDRSDPAWNHASFGKPQKIPGNATSIVSRWGGDAIGNRRYGGAGYWHWLFDSVSRLSLMDHFPSDTKIITPPLTPWMRWFLEKSGGEHQLIETEATSLEVEHLYFSSPSSMTGCWNPYAVDYLRRSFLPHGSLPSDLLPKRFYIIREGYTRGIANEEEVRNCFQSQGWSLIAPEKLPIPDQIALFRDAEAIAGLHGSALTNLVWCSEETKVVELISKGFMSGAFEWLAKLNELKHKQLICVEKPPYGTLINIEMLRERISVR